MQQCTACIAAITINISTHQGIVLRYDVHALALLQY
jgi:hypothetical protein